MTTEKQVWAIWYFTCPEHKIHIRLFKARNFVEAIDQFFEWAINDAVFDCDVIRIENAEFDVTDEEIVVDNMTRKKCEVEK